MPYRTERVSGRCRQASHPAPPSKQPPGQGAPYVSEGNVKIPTVNAEKFMGIVRKHLAFEELTPTLLREMIEKIVVHECSYDENGTRRQDIEIYYSFVGKIDLPE
ncbi:MULTISPECIES: DUF4368 domain-containing protein [Actinomycetota]|uniref:DUF4368 domain-containing protein n=2 Tax=Bacillati TaxID=1783272 RepID=UPI003D293311